MDSCHQALEPRPHVRSESPGPGRSFQPCRCGTLPCGPLPERPRGYVYNLDADNPMNTSKFQVSSEHAETFLDIAETVYGFKCEFPEGLFERPSLVRETLRDIDGREYEIDIHTDFVIHKRGTKVHFKRMSAGEKKILEVAIVGGTPESEQITSPCGRCRQVLLEYASIGKNDFPIYCANYNLSKIQLATICELVPIPFCPDQLLSS